MFKIFYHGKQVGPLIQHHHYLCAIRAQVSPAERLALTIRYLSTGNSKVIINTINLLFLFVFRLLCHLIFIWGVHLFTISYKKHAVQYGRHCTLSMLKALTTTRLVED